MSQKFVEAMDKKTKKNVAYGENGMKAKKTSLNSALDLYASMGASRGRFDEFEKYFSKSFYDDSVVAMQLLFMLRDIRCGMGERDLFRRQMRQLELTNVDLVLKVLPLIPKYGRWDDLFIFKTDKVMNQVVKLVANGLEDENTSGLVAKWLPRQGKTDHQKKLLSKIRSYLKLSPAEFRKKLVGLSFTVEQQMSANQWTMIDYSKVPSRAMTIYKEAFQRHDENGFSEYIQKLSSGETKVNASTLYPYNIVNQKSHSIAEANDELKLLAQKTWDSLPNYFGDKVLNVIPVIDVSGSMMCSLYQSSVQMIDVGTSIGMYVSQRSNGYFKNKYITFSQSPEWGNIESDKNVMDIFYNILNDHNAGLNTDVQKVFELIAQTAKDNHLSEDELPEYLMIISDMNFDVATNRRNRGVHKLAKKIFKDHGYKRVPIMIYWNLNHNGTFTVEFDTENAIMISGFSPSVLDHIFKAMSEHDFYKFTPEAVMIAALEKYQDVADALAA